VAVTAAEVAAGLSRDIRFPGLADDAAASGVEVVLKKVSLKDVELPCSPLSAFPMMSCTNDQKKLEALRFNTKSEWA
jgi:hypothetical protein